MSRLTGKDALGLFEAYNAVYTPQEEISEEQIWEKVEEWVNSLVEEGHDLSEFTWEEMYEAYLSEMGQPGGNVPGGNRPISNAPYRSRFARPMNANTPRQTGRGTSVSRPQIGGITGSTARTYRGQELQAGARAAASQVGTSRQGSAGTGAAPSSAARPSAARPSAAPAAKPAAAAKPSAAPAAKPAAAAKPAPSAAAKPAPTTTSKPITSQPPESKSQASAGEIRGMIGRSMERQASSTPAAAKPTPKPTPAATGSKKPGSVYSSFDMFDVVKGHLIDEGYAETEEAAIAIMANMSEEWKASIIDEAVKGESSERRKDLAAERRAGHRPLPAKEGEKYASHKLAQMAYAKRRRG